MDRLRLGVSLLVFGGLTYFAPFALANKQCDDAYLTVQNLRAGGKFVDARSAIDTCITVCNEDKPSAKNATIDCIAWSKEDVIRTPSVLISARDGLGNELSAVQVTIDDHVVATSLTGQPIFLNTGPHTIVLDGNGVREVRPIVSIDSERKTLSVVLGQVPVVPVTNRKNELTPPPYHDPAGGTSAVRVVGFVTAGLGLAGLGLGTYFGVHALGRDKDAMCDASNVCANPDARLDAQKEGAIATGALVAGGALFLGGVVMVLVAPSKSGATSARGPAPLHTLGLAPLVGSGTGFLLRGVF